MGDKFRGRQIIALRIQENRLKISEQIEGKIITIDDLIWVFKQNRDFGLKKLVCPKEKMLQEIFNAPFLLCDQSILNSETKKILFSFLEERYQQEIEELNCLCYLGYLTLNEKQEKIELLKYCYYHTSEDGKCILEKQIDNTNQENKVLKI